LERRFGAIPEALARQIEACADSQALDAGLDRVLEVGSLEEFRLGREDIGSAPSDPTPE
jgi:hypothetical protein